MEKLVNFLEAVCNALPGFGAIATVALAVIAWIQLRAINKSQREWATLQVCDRYDTDTVLAKVIRRLKRFEQGKSQKSYNPENDAIILLNYFDSISIGVKQGFYSDAIIRDHLLKIMTGWVAVLCESKNAIFDLHQYKSDYPVLKSFLDEEDLRRTKEIWKRGRVSARP